MDPVYNSQPTPPGRVAESPLPATVLDQAQALVRQYPGCFWFRHPEARILNREDVRLVVHHLREYGNRKAWYDAQGLYKLNREGEEWSKPTPFRKARVRRGAEEVEVDWAHDSAFRFFPIVPDSLFGWRLHLFDMATNKALALTARSETRDYVDILELSRLYPLAAIAWAACGKDPGFTPLSTIKWMKRFAKIDIAKLQEIKARALDPVAMKEEWLTRSYAAEEEIIRVADAQPDLPIGVAFVDAQGEPGWIGADPSLRPHAPSLRGTWPVVHAVGESAGLGTAAVHEGGLAP